MKVGSLPQWHMCFMLKFFGLILSTSLTFHKKEKKKT
jgi:hypothetical protein